MMNKPIGVSFTGSYRLQDAKDAERHPRGLLILHDGGSREPFPFVLSLYHLSCCTFCVHLPIPPGSAGHRFMTLWYSESSRGLGMWPAETLWWANSRPAHWARGSSTTIECLLSTFQIVTRYSLGLEGTTLGLSSLTSVCHLLRAVDWRCPVMVNSLPPRKLIPQEYLCENVHFYAKTNSVTCCCLTSSYF